MGDRTQVVLPRCRRSIPTWRGLGDEDFALAPPRGFSTFTMSVRCLRDVEPRAVLYRHLEGKENALLDFDDEKRVYLALADAGVAAPCLAYEREYRLEAFYEGRSLTGADLGDQSILQKIGAQLARLHAAAPEVPSEPFFERLFRRWGPMARRVLLEERGAFPPHERAMCDELLELLDPSTLAKVAAMLPDEGTQFCHNDTYHGNVMLLADGSIRLLDFEFSCRNHRSFDFANLFAETVMRHGLPDEPYFTIAEPEWSDDDIAAVVSGYVAESGESNDTLERLVTQTKAMIVMSDFMYAMAAIPLAVHPIQKIRFLPYSLQRYRRFKAHAG